VSEGPRARARGLRHTQKILHAKGLATPNWPVQWGGQDWSPVQRYIYIEELQAAAVPQPLGFNVTMVGPVIATFGSEAQKQRFLPGHGEPRHLVGAGVQRTLARGRTSPRSRPRRGGRGTSSSSTARRPGPRSASTPTGSSAWCGPTPTAKKQQGISFLLIDMKTPGVTVRPIITIDGGHEVNEVFFDEVRVPAENLVGRAQQGLGLRESSCSPTSASASPASA
jgi:alkylation response protein AidB-like acyl-CoA dehydrogenase